MATICSKQIVRKLVAVNCLQISLQCTKCFQCTDCLQIFHHISKSDRLDFKKETVKQAPTSVYAELDGPRLFNPSNLSEEFHRCMMIIISYCEDVPCSDVQNRQVVLMILNPCNKSDEFHGYRHYHNEKPLL